MKRTPSSLIALSVAAALLVLHVLYTRLSGSPIFHTTEKRFRRTSAPNHRNNDSAAPFTNYPQTNFTCDQTDSAVIDSFGTPCLNLTSLLIPQKLFVYSSNDLSYAFCGIPKNGCTYHIAMMHRLMGYPYEGASNVHHQDNKNRLRQANITHLLLSNNVPRYAVIRNPIHRVLSAYLNKVEKFYEKESQKTPESFHKWIYEEEALKPGINWASRNPHWVPQVEFCGFKVRDLANYFKVFRVEEPVGYLEYMESFLPQSVLKDGWDMPRNKSFRQHVLGPRTRTENTTARLFDYIGNLRMFDHLSEVYREDIKYLGYGEEVEKLRDSFIEHLEEKS